MKNSSQLRIDLVGCGRHGNGLAEAMIRSQSLQLVACADPDIQAANQPAVLAPDVSTHTSIEGLLADSEVDAIVIATPHHLLCSSSMSFCLIATHGLCFRMA